MKLQTFKQPCLKAVYAGSVQHVRIQKIRASKFRLIIAVKYLVAEAIWELSGVTPDDRPFQVSIK